jgi:DNA (cytosine-5)-methyltransferase 1
MKGTNMRFIDFFSGMGTARMGFEQAGHECVYSVEFDKHKRQIYKAVFGDEPQGGDIKHTTASEFPQADCWVAGFPCQDISVAGKQTGFTGERSSLFFEVVRLLRETEKENKPGYLLFENVKNFFSVNAGRDFLEALHSLDEVGYDTGWALLNSKHFGVPQNRERVFIVGHNRNRRTRKVFPLGRAVEKAGADINILAHRNGYRRNSQVYDIKGSIECLDTCGGGGREPHIQISMTQKMYKETNLVNTLTARHPSTGRGNFTPVTGGEVRAVLTPTRAEKRQNGRRMKEDGEPMFTLTGQDIHGVEVQSRIRRLTPRECFRLQAVPEHIIDKIQNAGISDTQCYRAAGDAMTVSVIYEIARLMLV